MWPDATVNTWIVSRSPASPSSWAAPRCGGAAPPLAPAQEATLLQMPEPLPSEWLGGGEAGGQGGAGWSGRQAGRQVQAQLPAAVLTPAVRSGVCPPSWLQQPHVRGEGGPAPSPPHISTHPPTRGIALRQHVLRQPGSVLPQEQVHVLAVKAVQRDRHLRTVVGVVHSAWAMGNTNLTCPQTKTAVGAPAPGARLRPLLPSRPAGRRGRRRWRRRWRTGPGNGLHHKSWGGGWGMRVCAVAV